MAISCAVLDFTLSLTLLSTATSSACVPELGRCLLARSQELERDGETDRAGNKKMCAVEHNNAPVIEWNEPLRCRLCTSASRMEDKFRPNECGKNVRRSRQKKIKRAI